jgi:hypothetical protein
MSIIALSMAALPCCAKEDVEAGAQPCVSTGRSIHAVPSITPSLREGIEDGPRPRADPLGLSNWQMTQKTAFYLMTGNRENAALFPPRPPHDASQRQPTPACPARSSADEASPERLSARRQRPAPSRDGHCHAAADLRSFWTPGSQRESSKSINDEHGQKPRRLRRLESAGRLFGTRRRCARPRLPPVRRR